MLSEKVLSDRFSLSEYPALRAKQALTNSFLKIKFKLFYIS